MDDFEPWRRLIRSILGAYEQLQIVGEAADGSEAVRKASALKPDLVLLDIGLPTVNGMDAANQIRKVSPRAKIIFVTQNRDVDVVNAALSNGASGYIFKTRFGKDLLPAVAAVLRGSTFVSGTMKTCGILQVEHSGHVWGDICGRIAAAKCADCGARICARHTETCGQCGVRFCGSCLGFHLAQHGKPARGEDVQRERKSA